ncbi:hypothetical protein FRC03_003378 [Tulasnella sp. 419]|nr:hypothetical protein FRC03_003378 [Tulasnella sp. 419]
MAQAGGNSSLSREQRRTPSSPSSPAVPAEHAKHLEHSDQQHRQSPSSSAQLPPTSYGYYPYPHHRGAPVAAPPPQNGYSYNYPSSSAALHQPQYPPSSHEHPAYFKAFTHPPPPGSHLAQYLASQQQPSTGSPSNANITPSQSTPTAAADTVSASPIGAGALEASASPAPPGASANTPTGGTHKRKRKGDAAKGPSKAEEDDGDGDKTKRTKTQRACDPCRRKKIRCDIIQDSDPLICQHCKQYGFECTFFLPITETRFKKKRMEEAAAAAAAVTAGGSSESKHDLVIRDAVDGKGSSTATPGPDGRGEVRVYGPTSISYMVHSTPSIPLRTFESHDQRYHQTWDVSKTGDGFIQVLDPTPDASLSPTGSSAAQLSSQFPTHKSIEHRLDRETLASLINAYFKEIAPQFPILTEAEFLSTSSPPPILLYAICVAAAARRGVPQEVFESLRMAVNQVLKSEDVMSTASVVNVQALLILSMNVDGHSSSISNAMTAAWLRLGAAIRMAQDLGMCRAEAVKVQVELRRRLWGACVIADRWYGACYGHPYMIDVLDCDVRLPTPDDPSNLDLRHTKPNCYLAELIKLSILLGKVTKTIYSPSGLSHATDGIIEALLAELDQWKDHLHPDLVFKGSDSIQPAGLLHLFFTCVCMMFWRVFMRLSYSCPAHLKFSLTIERWTALVQWSRDSIDWLDANERVFDSWMLVSYAASSCALIQYHTWARRKDQEAVASLKKLSDCVRRWESALQPGHMSARRKNAEIIILLYEATQLPEMPAPRPGDRQRLNPTVGVGIYSKVGMEGFRRLKFKKDPSRPGGGVFVADEQAIKEAVSDVPEGTVVVEEKNEDEVDGTEIKVEPQPTTVEKDGEDGLLVHIAPFQPGLGGAGSTGGSGVVQGTTIGGSWFGPSGLFGTGGMDSSVAGGAFGGLPADYSTLGTMPRPIVRPGSNNVNPTMNAAYGIPFAGDAQNVANGDTGTRIAPNVLAGPGPHGWGAASSSSASMFPGMPTGEVQVLNLLDQNLDGADALHVLEGIPDSVTWDGWDAYFARMSLPTHQPFANGIMGGSGLSAGTRGRQGDGGGS